MAVIKYKNENGEYVDILMPLNVIENTIVEPDVPEITTPTVKLPNMYHNATTDTPNKIIEYNVKGFNTLNFKYKVSQESSTANTKSSYTITVYLGGHYGKNLYTYELRNTEERVYVVSSFTKEAEGTYTLDVADYDTIVISISSNKASSSYAGEAGYVLIYDVMPE